MRIEAFTEARDPAAPEANEDALLLLPGRAFAVIDGVSARTPRRFEGMTTGRFAAQLVADTLPRLLADAVLEPLAVVDRLTAAIAAAHERLGRGDEVRADAGLRFSATLTLACLDSEVVSVLRVGDSGARINGTRVLQEHKPLDLITALLRQAAWQQAEAKGVPPAPRETLSRQVVLHGTAQDTAEVLRWFDSADLVAIGAMAQARAMTALPHLPATMVDALLRAGIVGGQGVHQNDADSPLGYSCLDGIPIPPSLVRIDRFPRNAVQRIELFTDGYFRPGDGFGIDAWERTFRAVEAEDPAKVRTHLAPKGSTFTTWADDRSYVGIELQGATA